MVKKVKHENGEVTNWGEQNFPVWISIETFMRSTFVVGIGQKDITNNLFTIHINSDIKNNHWTKIKWTN